MSQLKTATMLVDSLDYLRRKWIWHTTTLTKIVLQKETKKSHMNIKIPINLNIGSPGLSSLPFFGNEVVVEICELITVT